MIDKKCPFCEAVKLEDTTLRDLLYEYDDATKYFICEKHTAIIFKRIQEGKNDKSN